MRTARPTHRSLTSTYLFPLSFYHQEPPGCHANFVRAHDEGSGGEGDGGGLHSLMVRREDRDVGALSRNHHRVNKFLQITRPAENGPNGAYFPSSRSALPRSLTPPFSFLPLIYDAY